MHKDNLQGRWSFMLDIFRGAGIYQYFLKIIALVMLGGKQIFRITDDLCGKRAYKKSLVPAKR